MIQDRHTADEALVHATLAGERAAFGTLVSRYFPAVFALSYAHTGNRLDAEDAAQETFLRALRSLDRLRKPAVSSGCEALGYLECEYDYEHEYD